MNKLPVILLLLGFGLLADTVVVRQDYNSGENWILHTFMGQDFYILLANSFGGEQRLPIYTEGATRMRNLFGKYIDVNPIRNYNEMLPEEQHKTHFKLKDLFRKEVDPEGTLYSTKKLNAPLFINIPNARPPFFLGNQYDYDKDDFDKWRKTHPNFIGFWILTELDSDLRTYVRKMKTMPDGPVKQMLQAELSPPADQYEYGPFVEKLFAKQKALHFGCDEFWTMHSSSYIGHIMAKYGAKGIVYEATGQGVSRWQVAAAFLRGTSRQFNVPTAWYAAHWYSGWTRDGRHTEGENNPMGASYQYNGRYMGLSRTMVERQNWYAWLNGVSFLEHENWVWLHYDGQKDQKHMSSYARDLNALHEFARTNERGVTYTTTALLTPLFQQYNFLNGSNDIGVSFQDPYSQNAFFYTLLPVYAEDFMQHSLRKKGVQGGFFNSPFCEFYDVICPDARQSAADLEKALSAYKCAFLIGQYRKEDLDMVSLQRFVEAGGVLFISANQIQEGVVPSEFSGVSFGSETVVSGEFLVDETGARTALKDVYEWYVKTTGNAQAWLKDEQGAVIAYSNQFGKGKVITVSCNKMLPSIYMREKHLDFNKAIIEMMSARQTFEVIRYLLARVQDETLPIKVTGDVQYGINKTSGGWLLWMFNNKGVTKFTYEEEEIDLKQTAEARVELRQWAGAAICDIRTGKEIPATKDFFSATVAPGQVRVISVAQNKGLGE